MLRSGNWIDGRDVESSCTLTLAPRPRTFQQSARVSISRELPSKSAYLCVNHESQYVLNIVKSQDASLNPCKHSLVVGFTILDLGANTSDELWIRHSDLDVCSLLVSLEAIQVLSLDQLDRLYNRLVLCKSRLERLAERFAVGGHKANGRGNVKIMLKVCDVQQDRVAILLILALRPRIQARRDKPQSHQTA